MEFPESVVVLGAGGMAAIVYWQLRETTAVKDVIFVEDESDRTEIDLGDHVAPVLKTFDLQAARRGSRLPADKAFQHFTLAVSYPHYKRRFVEKALAAGLRPAPTLIHPTAQFSGPVQLEPGGLITHYTSVLPLSKIGAYVTIAPHVSVGHHCTLGQYSFLAPGSHVLGDVELGEGVWVGGAACVRGHLRVAPWVKIGLQAAVTSSVSESGIVVAGVPHRKLADAWHD